MTATDEDREEGVGQVEGGQVICLKGSFNSVLGEFRRQVEAPGVVHKTEYGVNVGLEGLSKVIYAVQ